MKSRIGVPFCMLLFSILAASATLTARAGAPRPPVTSPTYETQPGTRELPPRYAPPAGPAPAARLAYWNEVALRTIAVDHTPPFTGGATVVAEQLGPTRTSRLMAIVQLAVYDALNAIYRRYPGYSGDLPAFADSSPDAAIAQATHDILVAHYSRQRQRLDAWLAQDLARLPDGRRKLDGVDIGRRAAAALLALRADDGVYYGEPVVGIDYHVSDAPGKWRPDPVSGIRIALGAYWHIKPFVLPSTALFRPPPPPALTSDTYARAFNEVKAFGGDGILTPTRRTPDQTRIGIFWSYDGGAWIGTRPRLYNQIAVQLALQRSADPLELARVLALVNAAIADATIAAWEDKYRLNFWRPVTAIREASPGTGPTGLGDGNPTTRADPYWTPLGAQASNLTGPNFTPPFPAYPSGHAELGSAMFQILRRFYGDNVAFTFLSDELNGITRDNRGRVRPRAPRSYRTLAQAEEENGQSRIYLGIHWQFDKAQGIVTGRQVADYIFQRGLVRPDQ
ncbi:vanadium-dependent haloperoxidase [Massilia aerilata]|uniref:Vanadium-dependent haloperoxidase n=1 Tax=Massilia aerilata TaxID=453817 RepID=A0ABW0S467_9BURK